jgi:hypothetical protein
VDANREEHGPVFRLPICVGVYVSSDDALPKTSRLFLPLLEIRKVTALSIPFVDDRTLNFLLNHEPNLNLKPRENEQSKGHIMLFPSVASSNYRRPSFFHPNTIGYTPLTTYRG